jgi:hypothetical protein
VPDKRVEREQDVLLARERARGGRRARAHACARGGGGVEAAPSGRLSDTSALCSGRGWEEGRGGARRGAGANHSQEVAEEPSCHERLDVRDLRLVFRQQHQKRPA